MVVVPVLGRPANAPRVLASLRASQAQARLLFVCSSYDHSELRACQRTGADLLVVDFPHGRGDWARKINAALLETSEPWLLLGADDLKFHPRWDTEALRAAEQSGCGVIGTNDLGNPYVQRGNLATHALVSRRYAMEEGTIDEQGKILHEGYWHNWVDAELTETARSRNQFAFARRSIVEHLHPHWGKAQMDATYELGLNQRRFETDRKLLIQRRKLWIAGFRRNERKRPIRRRA